MNKADCIMYILRESAEPMLGIDLYNHLCSITEKEENKSTIRNLLARMKDKGLISKDEKLGWYPTETIYSQTILADKKLPNGAKRKVKLNMHIRDISDDTGPCYLIEDGMFRRSLVTEMNGKVWIEPITGSLIITSAADMGLISDLVKRLLPKE